MKPEHPPFLKIVLQDKILKPTRRNGVHRYQFKLFDGLPLDPDFKIADTVTAGIQLVFFPTFVKLKSRKRDDRLPTFFHQIGKGDEAALQFPSFDGIGGGVEFWPAPHVEFCQHAEWFWVQIDGRSHSFVAVISVGDDFGFRARLIFWDDKFASVGLDRGFDDLPAPDLEGVAEARNEVRRVVQFGFVCRLPVVRAEGKNPVIARTFQTIADEGGKKLPSFFRSPVKKQPEISLVRDRRIQRVGAVERQAILARLHIFKTERDFALPETKAKFIVFVQTYIKIGIAELPKMQPSRRRAARKIWLDVEINSLRNLPKKNDSHPAEEKAAILADASVALFATQIFVGFEQAVVPNLGVASD